MSKLAALLKARQTKIDEIKHNRENPPAPETFVKKEVTKTAEQLAMEAQLATRGVKFTTSEKVITLNERQQMAVNYGIEGREFVLIGAAGTGKTTSLREIFRNLMAAYGLDGTETDSKVLSIVAFTRRAARNAAKALKEINGQNFCSSVHKFLEFAPEYFDFIDPEGNFRKTMQFLPRRNKHKPITEARLIVIDEASMLDYEDLFQKLVEACPNAKFVFVGDLNQLPPVMGKAVLGYKLTELPVVELNEVYRQAMDSPIVAFQHKYTLRGLAPSEKELQTYTANCTDDKGLEFKPFKKPSKDDFALSQSIAAYMIRELDAGRYDPEQDTILIPWNKSFGSDAINEIIAQELGIRREAVVWEILAGMNKKYLAVDDFVMYEKAECIVTSIKRNPKYMGTPALAPSKELSRSGVYRGDCIMEALNQDKTLDKEEFDLMVQGMEEAMQSGGKFKAASAIVTLEDKDSGVEYILSTTGEISGIDFGYAMTIHKSQGSEWRKVWMIMHRLHASMCSRELLYTGMTRARDRLAVLYSPDTRENARDSVIAKAIKSPKIKGNTWQDKAKQFAAAKEDKHSSGYTNY